MFRVCFHFESRYIGHTNTKDIWYIYILQIFSGLLTRWKNIFLSWQAEYSHFAIQRWRCLDITHYRIFSCCVSCNGPSLGSKYLWNTLEKNSIYIYMYIYIYRYTVIKACGNWSWNGPNKPNGLKGPDRCRIDNAKLTRQTWRTT